jgi:Tfp pilus assembly protein PilV
LHGGQPRSDAGTTLVEVLIATLILATAGIAILAATRTTITVSGRSADRARIASVLSDAADRIIRSPYTPCGGPSSFLAQAQAAAGAVGWPADAVEIVSVDYWDADLEDATRPVAGAWVSTCTATAVLTPQRTLTRVTVRVTSPSGDTSRTQEVVRSDV